MEVIMIVGDHNIEDYLVEHGWRHEKRPLEIEVFWSDEKVDAILHIYNNDRYGLEYYLIEATYVPEIDFDKVRPPHVNICEMDYTDLPFLFASSERDELSKNDYIILSDRVRDEVKEILGKNKSIYSIPWAPLDKISKYDDREVELYFGATPLNEYLDREMFRKIAGVLLEDLSFRRFLLNKYVVIKEINENNEVRRVMKEKEALEILEKLAYQ